MAMSALETARATARRRSAAPDPALAAIAAEIRRRPGAPLALSVASARDAGAAVATEALDAEHALAALALGAITVSLAPADPAASTAALAVVAVVRAMLTAIGVEPRLVGVEGDAPPRAPVRPPLADLDWSAPRGLRMRACLAHLARVAGGWNGDAPLPLPAGAPAGAVTVSQACTLCFACTPECPTGALARGAEGVALVFREDACVQCGLCVEICPEGALAPLPRLAPPAAPVILAEDAPATCPDCGARFGSRRSLDQVRARLAADGWAAQNPELLARLALCEDCRARP
ncbi:MAG: hypothetical protein EA355_16115 [Rhodobacteraceae bacterium]|nr:MAG: hypothetical protein EA355_16115 [Paracoccaceae bacterium]